jgi:phospholipase A1
MKASIVLAAAVLLVAGTPPCAAAQLGRIAGTVRDMSGRPMMDVFVSVHPIDHDAPKRDDRTDAAGHFHIDSLTPGPYRIDFVRVGYAVHSDTVQVAAIVAAGDTGVTVEAGLRKMPASAYFNILEPNYFLTGNQHDVTPGTYANEVKFRIAVRYELIELRRTMNQTGIYVAYTQNSFWNIREASAPFLDNNYNPKAFLYIDAADYPDHLRSLPSFRLAAEHESNGRDGAASRSWNRVALDAGFGDPASTVWYGFVKGWVPWGRDDNWDIQQFVGRSEADVYWQPGIHQQRSLGAFGAGLKLRLGGNRFVTNEELDVFWGPLTSYRPENARGRWHPSWILQVFDGYGENLLLYRERRTVVRVGLATVR